MHYASFVFRKQPDARFRYVDHFTVYFAVLFLDEPDGDGNAVDAAGNNSSHDQGENSCPRWK